MSAPKFKEIAISQLRLDPDNPRFIAADVSTENLDEFLPWFDADADVLSVADSLASNGYFGGEPLLVAPGSDGAGPVVVEGNRRFAAVLLLRNPDYLPRPGRLREMAERANLEDLEKLPCAAYGDRDQILDYLGNRHIVGVKEWKPLAKARYLRQLRDRADKRGTGTDDKSLARNIGSRSDYVRRLLNSLEAFERLEERGIAKKDEARFSLLQTALQYSSISDYAGIDLQNEPDPERINDEALDDIGRWTLQPDPEGKGRAPRVNSRTLPELSKIVASERARDAFREGASIDQALRLTSAAAEALESSMAEAATALREARSHAAELDEAASDRHQAALRELEELVRGLASDLDSDSDDHPS
jgi:hypothetical protein